MQTKSSPPRLAKVHLGQKESLQDRPGGAREVCHRTVATKSPGPACTERPAWRRPSHQEFVDGGTIAGTIFEALRASTVSGVR
jgi:hypothetical protein